MNAPSRPDQRSRFALPILLSLSASFRMHAAPPAITTIAPQVGPTGSCVTITGSDFSNPTVTFGTLTAELVRTQPTSSSKLVVTVPGPVVAGPLAITVKNDSGESTTPDGNSTFQVQELPKLSLSRETVFVGSAMVLTTSTPISGNDVNKLKLSLGSADVPLTGASAGALQFSVSTLPAGKYPVSVKSVDCFAITGPTLTIIEKPLIKSFSPVAGNTNDTITIDGTHFENATAVTVGGCSTTLAQTTDSQLKVVLQKECPGPVQIATRAGDSDPSEKPFSIERRARISSINPQTAEVGQPVTIGGRNFNSLKAANHVYFGGAEATVKFASESELYVNVPPGASDGIISVDNGAGAGRGYSDGAFHLANTQMFIPGKGATIGTGDKRTLIAWMPGFHGIRTKDDELWAPPGATFLVTGDVNASGDLAVVFTSVPKQDKTGEIPSEALESGVCKCVRAKVVYNVPVTQLSQTYPTQGSGFTFGILAVPFKFYFSDHSLGGAGTVGGYLGYQFSSVGVDISAVGAAGVGVVPISTIVNGETSTKNAPSLSAGLGLILNLTKNGGFQAGLFVGADWAGTSSGFPYEGKPWLALSLGTSLSK